MSRRLVLILVTAAAVAVAGVGWAVGLSPDQSTTASNGSGSNPGTVSQPVTEFAPAERGDPVALGGATLTGGMLRLRELRGNVVVLNVWGSWCGPCRVEAPILARLSREYANQDVSFLGVNVKDNRAAAIAFEDQFNITYPSIEDPDGRAMLRLTRIVPASTVPVTLVLDRQGRVAARVFGAVREATLRALLTTAIAEPP